MLPPGVGVRPFLFVDIPFPFQPILKSIFEDKEPPTMPDRRKVCPVKQFIDFVTPPGVDFRQVFWGQDEWQVVKVLASQKTSPPLFSFPYLY